jgi:hypothetical protein
MPIYWRALWEARHLQLIWLGEPRWCSHRWCGGCLGGRGP